MKKALLLSAYDAGSHRRWREGVVQNLTTWEWTSLSLPPRYFRWRIRGNPLSWFFEQKKLLSQNYDLILATSMVDLATLKGLFSNLAQIPTLVYFHENQFQYPKSELQHQSIEPQMVNLYSALASDQILFNSEFNRATFLQGVERLMKKLPDHAPANLVKTLLQQSSILPVPLESSLFESKNSILDGVEIEGEKDTFTIVWNHRWEYDKAPERFYRALQLLKDRGVKFRFHLLGEKFRKAPPVFEKIKKEFISELETDGFVESRKEYWKILRTSHVVVSTSLHEFQGLSVLDAVALGCLPVVPHRLSYPEYFEDDFLYDSWEDDADAEQEAQALANKLAEFASLHVKRQLPPAPNLEFFSWKFQKSAYEKHFQSCL